MKTRPILHSYVNYQDAYDTILDPIVRRINKTVINFVSTRKTGQSQDTNINIAFAAV